MLSSRFSETRASVFALVALFALASGDPIAAQAPGRAFPTSGYRYPTDAERAAERERILEARVVELIAAREQLRLDNRYAGPSIIIGLSAAVIGSGVVLFLSQLSGDTGITDRPRARLGGSLVLIGGIGMPAGFIWWGRRHRARQIYDHEWVAVRREQRQIERTRRLRRR